MAHVREITARKDMPEHGIVKGQKYWRWRRREGREGHDVVMTTPPRQSDLATGDYKPGAHRMNEILEDWDPHQVDMEEVRQEIVTMCRELEEMMRERISRFPKAMMTGPVPTLMSIRVEDVEEFRGRIQAAESPTELRNTRLRVR